MYMYMKAFNIIQIVTPGNRMPLTELSDVLPFSMVPRSTRTTESTAEQKRQARKASVINTVDAGNIPHGTVRKHSLQVSIGLFSHLRTHKLTLKVLVTTIDALGQL